MAEYHSISDLVKLSINNKQELWQVVLTGQAHDKLMSERDVFAQMKKMYQAMKSADEQYDQQLRSPSKMAGGDGYKMRIYNESGRNICGDFIGVVMEKALKMYFPTSRKTVNLYLFTCLLYTSDAADEL